MKLIDDVLTPLLAPANVNLESLRDMVQRAADFIGTLDSKIEHGVFVSCGLGANVHRRPHDQRCVRVHSGWNQRSASSWC